MCDFIYNLYILTILVYVLYIIVKSLKFIEHEVFKFEKNCTRRNGIRNEACEFNMSLVFAPNARHVQNMRCYLNQMRREYPTHVFSIRNFCGTVKIFATKAGEKNEDLI